MSDDKVIKYEEIKRESLPALVRREIKTKDKYKDPENIKIVIALMGDMIGVSNLPSGTFEKSIIAEIQQEFWRFTLNEFVLAARLYCQKKLDVSVEHYNKFSLAFLHDLMGAYDKFRYTEKVKIEKQKQEERDRRLQLTPYDKDMEMLRFFKKLNNDYLLRKTTKQSYTTSMYLWLEELGMIKYSEADKLRIYNKATEEYKRQCISDKQKKLLIKDVVREMEFYDDRWRRNIIVSKARKRALREFLYKAKKGSIDVVSKAEKAIKKRHNQ